MKTSNHLSDTELLLLQTGELSARPASNAQYHLSACDGCRLRLAELEATLGEVKSLSARAGDSNTASLRSKLIAEMPLNETGGKVSAASKQRANFLYGTLRPFAFVCLAIMGVTLVGRFVPASGHPPSRNLLSPWQASLLPSKSLTPGVTKTVGLSDLCSTQASTARVPIDDSTARKVFQEYGLPFALRKNYEVDYLITPGLGGSSDIRNLWPEPDESANWNAHVKDTLEDHLHDLVCDGKLPLATAQSEIADDWIAAYKKHFHTDKPLPGSVSLSDRMTPLHAVPKLYLAEQRRRG
jgi:hypothetical protein